MRQAGVAVREEKLFLREELLNNNSFSSPASSASPAYLGAAPQTANIAVDS
ncbi:MAG: hypothetical protein ICV54_19930 [Nostoc sp. C3-bin3]|nr:hypothetical protein [Nostoc sp. C3-bin3]